MAAWLYWRETAWEVRWERGAPGLYLGGRPAELWMVSGLLNKTVRRQIRKRLRECGPRWVLPTLYGDHNA